MTEVADTRTPSRRLASPVVAWLLAALVVVLLASYVVLAAATHELTFVSYFWTNLLVIASITLPVLAVFWALFVLRQVLAWRQARDERRQQLKWLMSGTAVAIVCTALTVVVGTLDVSAGPAVTAAVGIISVGIVALPVGIGVAILKYRLYEIDRIISRTLAYAIVTGLLVGVYAGLVLLSTQVLKFHSTVAVAASTLVAAALFHPVRRRVQRAVDRRFNRARYDADRMVAAFAARLQDAVDLNSAREDLAAVVYRALEPAHVSVWISQDS
jgi:hypothetical protein